MINAIKTITTVIKYMYIFPLVNTDGTATILENTKIHGREEKRRAGALESSR